jgi:quinolinate synthase
VTGPAALQARIRELALERDAIVLAHNYQRPEVQDVADLVGDSLGLSRRAAEADARVIVFAGVHFMAETAAILAPDRTVVLPEHRAGCPMADMITPDALREWRARHPGVPVVTYVNSTADVKALSDVCVTSANAVQVVRALGAERIIFAPDRNLAAWVAQQLPEIEVIAWPGFCPTHDRVTPAMVTHAVGEHPGAEVLVHPECRPEVTSLATAVLSTSQMIRRAAESESSEFIVVTEQGLIHGLRKAAPDKLFHELDPPLACPNMKLTTLASVLRALETLEPRITVPVQVRDAALAAVRRMVETG